MVNIADFLGNVEVRTLIPRVILSLVILVLGIIVGKLINFGLKSIVKSIDLEKKVKKGIVDLTLTVIRWSIYILFFSVALNYLNLSNLTGNIISVLMTIPALVGALFLIMIGFSIAYFVKSILKNSEIRGVEIVSEVVFYFIVYISGIYAVKTALISLGEEITNYLIMILTAAFAGAGAYLIAKKHSKSS